MEFNPQEISSYLITNKDTILNCIHGGKGQLVLTSPTGQSHCYLFLKPRNEREFQPGTIFVYVKHESYKYYLGMLTADNVFKLTCNSRFEYDTEAVKGAYYIVKMSSNQELINKSPMKLYHFCRCARCGRLLNSEQWLELGIGRRCMHKYLEDRKRTTWDGNS